MNYRIGTRASRLAMAQATYIKNQLEAAHPADTFTLVPMQTTGDRLNTTPLRQIGGSGVFVKAIEEGLRTGTLDLAVHSMKDMESTPPETMAVVFCGHRADPRDALLLREAASLDDLPPGAVIGTGSPRRTVQLLRLRPDLQVVGLRGNIETRIRKMQEQNLDGIVLAVAGLARLGLEGRITHIFSPEEMVPAPAQGVLGVEYRKDRTDLAALLAVLRDPVTEPLVRAERRFLQLTRAGCHQPVGASARWEGDAIRLRVLYGEEDGSRLTCFAVTAPDHEAAAQAAFVRIQTPAPEGDPTL